MLKEKHSSPTMKNLLYTAVKRKRHKLHKNRDNKKDDSADSSEDEEIEEKPHIWRKYNSHIMVAEGTVKLYREIEHADRISLAKKYRPAFRKWLETGEHKLILQAVDTKQLARLNCLFTVFHLPHITIYNLSHGCQLNKSIITVCVFGEADFLQTLIGDLRVLNK